MMNFNFNFSFSFTIIITIINLTINFVFIIAITVHKYFSTIKGYLISIVHLESHKITTHLLHINLTRSQEIRITKNQIHFQLYFKYYNHHHSINFKLKIHFIHLYS